MNYFLALCGLILLILTAPSVLSGRPGEGRPAVAKAKEREAISPVLLEYLQSLEDRLEAMADALAEMNQVMNRYITVPKQKPEQAFTEVLHHAKQDNKPLSVNDQIYQAYLKGKSVTELAQEFGKGKGEIELILNLKRS